MTEASHTLTNCAISSGVLCAGISSFISGLLVWFGNKKTGRKRGKSLFARYNAGIAVWAIPELAFDFIYDFCGKSNRKIIARRKQSADKIRALPVGQGF